MKNRIKIMKETYSDTKLSLPTIFGNVLLSWTEICYFKSDDNYCELFTIDNEKYHVSKSLKWVEEKLLETCFFRVHKSYLINIYHIVEYHKTGTGTLIMRHKKKIPISRNTKKRICLLMNCI